MKQLHHRLSYALLDRIDSVVEAWSEEETQIFRGSVMAEIIDGSHTLKGFERRWRLKSPKHIRAGSVTIHVSMPEALIERIDRVVDRYGKLVGLPATRTAIINSILEGTRSLADFEASVKRTTRK